MNRNGKIKGIRISKITILMIENFTYFQEWMLKNN
jgi:hypothetical protein